MELDLEKIIDSINPKSQKERRKLHKALSQVSIQDFEGHRIVSVPQYTMGVIHRGLWYCNATLREAVVIKTYEKSYKRECACVRDIYGNHWYYMLYDDTIYDDVHFVYIGVENEGEAESLYRKIGLCTHTYFHYVTDDWRYPFFRLNISDYLVYGTDDLSTTPEQYMELLIVNNDLLL